MAKDTNRTIWNADIKMIMEDGYDIVNAMDSLSYALEEAMRPDIVGTLIGTKKKPVEFVSVRIETVELLVAAWSIYKECYERGDNKTFGQCLGLEGTKKGQHRALGRIEKRNRGVTYAVWIEEFRNEGSTRAEAIALTAKEFDISEDTILKAIGPPDEKRLQAAIKQQLQVRR